MSRSPIKLFIVLLLLSGVLFFGDLFAFLSPLRAVVEQVTAPLVHLLYQGGQEVDSFFSPLTRPWRQQREIDYLKRKLVDLATISARLAVVEKENQALRQQMEVSQGLPNRTILAHPIAQERYLIIDKGAADGVSVGATVVSGEVLLGRVVAVTPHTASVLLPFDPESAIPVWTSQLSRGIVKGVFGKTMILDEVLQSDPLEQGEVVLTTGGSGYTQNLAVAMIGKIKSEPREVFKTAELTPLVDIKKLTTVFVILPK